MGEFRLFRPDDVGGVIGTVEETGVLTFVASVFARGHTKK